MREKRLAFSLRFNDSMLFFINRKRLFCGVKISIFIDLLFVPCHSLNKHHKHISLHFRSQIEHQNAFVNYEKANFSRIFEYVKLFEFILDSLPSFVLYIHTSDHESVGCVAIIPIATIFYSINVISIHKLPLICWWFCLFLLLNFFTHTHVCFRFVFF